MMISDTKKIARFESTPHVVALLDVLGSKAAITKDADAYMAKMHDIYTSALKMSNDFGNLMGEASIKTKIFSDNILIAAALGTSNLDTGRFSGEAYNSCCNIYFVLNFLASFQLVCLQSGFLIRGGVTIGNLFFDDVMVNGQGLLRAYELESQVAVYPRVILDSLICKCLNVTFITRDFDGAYYIDYLKFWQLSLFIVKRRRSGELYIATAYERGYGPDFENEACSVFDAIKANFENNLNRDCANEPNRISFKLNWHTRYLGSFLYGLQSSDALIEKETEHAKSDKWVYRGREEEETDQTKWYLEAARTGDVIAQRLLGEAYCWGRVVRANGKEAEKWLLLAAKAGDVIAQRLLGQAYCQGRVVRANGKEAEKWLLLAAKNGDEEAQQYLQFNLFKDPKVLRGSPGSVLRVKVDGTSDVAK